MRTKYKDIHMKICSKSAASKGPFFSDVVITKFHTIIKYVSEVNSNYVTKYYIIILAFLSSREALCRAGDVMSDRAT